VLIAVGIFWQLMVSISAASIAYFKSDFSAFVAALLGIALFVGVHYGISNGAVSFPRQFRFHGPVFESRAALMRAALGAMGGGFAVGLAGSSALDLSLRATSGVVIGLILLTTMVLIAPADEAQAASPGGVLIGDRNVALANAATSFAVYGLPLGLLLGNYPDKNLAIVAAVLVGSLSALIVSITSTAWGRFALTRAYLASRGKVPWRLLTFLEDAHHRGALRQSGAVYQFRHSQLRDRLAQARGASDEDLHYAER
jgi:hypothetical protein